MTSGFFIHILLFLCVCSSLTSITNGLTSVPSTSNNNNNNNKDLSFLHKYFGSSIPSQSNLLKEFSLNIQQRNVIMPRICYFARISGTGIYQKYCLPYNGIHS
ncbi:unnamed protein product [Rotaria sordida]|uniref:Uncharacterized protein n=1 Tax=Rotaria sordida TaxID=392033 RepID=A0A815ETN2_9BILA|nr:unnamed protein product [Rotaria sordida]CAF1316483.1 unnamed protein product [Rotaria sordida]CAF1427952.1 unnamed protein product [Rotaria sordida]CAF4060917.1 unnamed protein product [Rotaria sordida]